MNKRVVSLNIERLRKLLRSEANDDKRRALLSLLAEEQKKMDALIVPAPETMRQSARQCENCGGTLQILTKGARLRAPRDHVETTYFGCTRCVHIQIDDHVTPAGDHLTDVLRLAMAELGATMGNIQLLDWRSQTLFIAAQTGFERPFLDYFHSVSVGDNCACGIALREQKRIIVEDVDTDEAWKPMLAVAREAGFRAVQSTPLLGRDNTVTGMLSTHFDSPHRPSDGDFKRMAQHVSRAFDLIA